MNPSSRRLSALAVLTLLHVSPLFAADGDNQTYEWAYWGGDERSSRYSPLDQVDASNFGKLEVAWRWSAANYGPEPDLIYRATPIYVNGKLYTVAGSVK